MEDNDVYSFKGLSNLKYVEDLYLRGNPITFLINYRQRYGLSLNSDISITIFSHLR